MSIMLSKGGFLNPDQYCKAFDESANGYVRGEGVGVVILKPMRQAIADGDAIYACVLGSAVNQDGYLAEGYTVPNVFSQIALLNTVYADAGIDPSTVDYVEAHGTGTPVGDPVETSALGSVMGFERGEEQPNLLIGSVKTNLGHLEGASGITGFIKGVLTAHHRIAPRNLHFNEPNPAIPWEHYRLEVPTESTRLDPGDRPLTVGVNSFGAGGANAHVVLQELAKSQTNGQAVGTNERVATANLYTLSAANRDALRALALRHADFLAESDHALDDVACSAFARRSHYPHLMAVVGRNAKDIADRLRKFADGEVNPETLATTIAYKKDPKLAFVFSGQGGQWAGMGLKLIERESVFRESMEEIDALFSKLAGWSLLTELRQPADDSRINDTVVVQPAVMAIQISLVKLYEYYGIRADGFVGHSIGEVAAGYASRALTLEQAVEVIYQRSQAQNRAAGKGGMLAVGLSLDEVHELIEGREGVSIGAVNGPEMLTLSGDIEPLEKIANQLESRGVFHRAVKVEVAYHSHHMEPIKDLMLESLGHIQGVQAARSLYSTVTGEREDGLHLNGSYWYENVRQPVLFTDAIREMLDDGFDTFVEIGPHPVLVRGAEALIEKRGADAVMAPAMTRKEPEVTVFLQSLARLSARGINPNTDRLFGTGRHYVRLPRHPWQHSRYWFEAPAATRVRLGPFENPFLQRQTPLVTEEGLAAWDGALSVQKFPYLRDHQVDGEIVFPATGHIELAWAVASEQFLQGSFFLENLRFDSPLIVPDNSRHPLDVRLEIVSSEGSYRICSRPANESSSEGTWTKHSSGKINAAHDRFERSTMSLDEITQRFQGEEPTSIDQFYENLYAAGLAYGEQFRLIKNLQHNELPNRHHEWLAQLQLPDDLVFESQRNYVHPALLDACLHVVFADVHRIGNPDRIFLPHRIDRLRVYRRPTQNIWARILVTRNDERYLCSDTLIFDEHGELVAEVLGLACKRLAAAGSQQTDSVYEGCYEYRWQQVQRDDNVHIRNNDFTTAVLIAPDRQGAEEEQVVSEITTRLTQQGIRTRVVLAAPDVSYDQQMADVALDRRTLIVFAAGLSRRSGGWRGLENCPHVPALLHLAQLLHRREGVPRLCVITNGATDVANDQQLDLGQAILHGMSRVINNECPNIPLSLIDVSAVIAPQEVEALVGDLLHSRRDRDESEIALRGDKRYVRQLLPVDRESAEAAAETQESGCGGGYRANLSDPGLLDHITFRRLLSTEPREDEVQISVQAAGLTYRDVMNAMGVLPDNAVAGGLTGQRLGLEVAGRVECVGPSVQNVQVGDEVIARVREGFCGRVTTPAHYVVRRPSHLSPVEAAAIPVVFVTAWYSLCHLARMDSGDTVLIHSAAGGVGGAAIQFAQREGATIIATAGTKEKREYLRQKGIEHVFDSRSLDFHNRVMEVTDGRGVDIVLNFLSGRFITQSLKCLAPFGRFLELGKSDIYHNSKLNLERFGENISYHVVDIDRFAAQKPDQHQRIMSEVVELFERGDLKPLETTEFPISELPDALKFMTRAAYTGKIVINMEQDQVRTLPPSKISFRADRAYLISGGAGGFGLEIARWMVERGARELILVSRSGPKTEYDLAAVDSMVDQGVRVHLPHVDITDRPAVDELLQQIKSDVPPLAGVIHAAAVMDDATIPNIDMTRFERVFQPKAQGAWNLHESTLAAGTDLDFFVMLSSISSAFGFVGQVNYAAANYFQTRSRNTGSNKAYQGLL